MASNPIRIWDLPIRLVHWSLVLLLPLLWLTAENHRMDLHFTLGTIMLGLLVFRLIWGLAGSSTARFSSFVRGPGAIRAYLADRKTGSEAASIGHNPLGALSVIVLIAILGLQVGLGLFATNEDAEGGPLSHLVAYETQRAAAEVHEILFNVALGLIALHIAAILYYRFIRRDKLVTPMITGKRSFPHDVIAPRIAPLWQALVCALVAAALAVWVSWGLPPWGQPFPWDRPAQVQQMDPASYM